MRHKKRSGYTLTELAIIVVIIGILSSLLQPQFDLLLVKANQTNSKSNLGNMRTAISVYYANNGGDWPLSVHEEGDLHYVNHGESLYGALSPNHIEKIMAPSLKDRLPFNGLGVRYDLEAARLMAQSPPKDVFIIRGGAAYTPLLNSPFAYDNHQGFIYIPNGNLDHSGEYFFNW